MKDEALDYAKNIDIVGKDTMAEIIQEMVGHGKASHLSKIVESKDTLFHICRIIRVINVEHDKKYRDFFTDLKEFVEAIESYKKIKKKK